MGREREGDGKRVMGRERGREVARSLDSAVLILLVSLGDGKRLVVVAVLEWAGLEGSDEGRGGWSRGLTQQRGRRRRRRGRGRRRQRRQRRQRRFRGQRSAIALEGVVVRGEGLRGGSGGVSAGGAGRGGAGAEGGAGDQGEGSAGGGGSAGDGGRRSEPDAGGGDAEEAAARLCGARARGVLDGARGGRRGAGAGVGDVAGGAGVGQGRAAPPGQRPAPRRRRPAPALADAAALPEPGGVRGGVPAREEAGARRPQAQQRASGAALPALDRRHGAVGGGGGGGEGRHPELPLPRELCRRCAALHRHRLLRPRPRLLVPRHRRHRPRPRRRPRALAGPHAPSAGAGTCAATLRAGAAQGVGAAGTEADGGERGGGAAGRAERRVSPSRAGAGLVQILPGPGRGIPRRLLAPAAPAVAQGDRLPQEPAAGGAPAGHGAGGAAKAVPGAVRGSAQEQRGAGGGAAGADGGAEQVQSGEPLPLALHPRAARPQGVGRRRALLPGLERQNAQTTRAEDFAVARGDRGAACGAAAAGGVPEQAGGAGGGGVRARAAAHGVLRMPGQGDGAGDLQKRLRAAGGAGPGLVRAGPLLHLRPGVCEAVCGGEEPEGAVPAGVRRGIGQRVSRDGARGRAPQPAGEAAGAKVRRAHGGGAAAKRACVRGDGGGECDGAGAVRQLRGPPPLHR
eukprot:3932607-Rhodomonas_salina.2